jgi:uncharacterized surface protein with fasciclin (FAS1) repeats
MKTFFRISAAAVLLAAPAVVAAQAPAKNIVETAVAAGSFNTLVAAVKAAGLAETLSGPGPFTVFAPSDAAFAKLPAGTVDALLKDKAKLAAILTYHVVPGKVMAADVLKMKSGNPKTVNGQTVAIVVRDGKVFVDGAQVVTTDIVASNGVIHVIDSVIMPKSDKK